MGTILDDVNTAQMLIDTAMKGKHRDFEFIRDWGERAAVKTVRDACDKVAWGFNKLCKKLMKTYLKSLKLDVPEMDCLVAYKQFKMCAEFYKEESDLMNYMLAEHEAYMFSGHFGDFVFGKYRPDEDLVDYLKGEDKCQK